MHGVGFCDASDGVADMKDPNPPPEFADARAWVDYVGAGGWPSLYAAKRFMPLIKKYIETLELDAAGVPENERS